MFTRKAAVLALSVFTAVGLAACEDDDPGGPQAEVFVATLTGAKETTPNTVTAVASGRVEFTATGLTWTLNITTALPVVATMAHIHSPGIQGINAPVTLNLSPNLTVTSGLFASGSATTAAAGVTMDSLKAHIRTGRAYMNIHAATPYTGGIIRGQLEPGN
jgi:membrane-associated phospholipid phosphatase